jgi:hypothetical protein
MLAAMIPARAAAPRNSKNATALDPAMSTLSLLLLLTATLLTAGLGLYALTLWRRVWRKQKSQAEAAQAQKERLGGDLFILNSSLLEGQLPLIEGAIRIKVLLDNYDIALSQSKPCEVFHQLFAATAHVPTHAEWKALDKSARRQHELRFSELELQHKAAARAAARWLLDEALPPLRKSA